MKKNTVFFNIVVLFLVLHRHNLTLTKIMNGGGSYVQLT